MADSVSPEVVSQQSEDFYRPLFENLLNGCAYCHMLYKDGKPDDFIYLAVNAAFGLLTGLKDVVGKKVSEVIPNIRETDFQLIETYGRIARGGKPEQFELFLEALKMWVLISVYCPKPEHFVAVFDVITERKQTEMALQKMSSEMQRLLDVSAAGLARFNRDQHYLSANFAYAKLVGMPLEQIIGNSIVEVIGEIRYAAITPYIERVLNGERIEYEINVPFKYSGIQYLHVVFTPDEDDLGNIMGWVASVTDITERKQAEQALAESQKFLLDLIEHSGTIIYAKDIAGSYQLVNEKFEEVAGIKRENVLGKKDSELFPEEASKQFRENDLLVMERGTTMESEEGLENETGMRYFLSVKFPVRDNNDRIKGICGMSTEITKRKNAEEEREKNLVFVGELLNNAPIGICVFDGETGKCILINQVSADIARGEIETMKRQNFRELESWQTSGLSEVAEAVLADGCARTVETDILTSYGKQASITYIVSKFFVGETPHLLIIGRDITVEKELLDKNRKIEAQMLHAQKLESLGVLAGGIAHDFNNILLAILGNAELALLRLVPESPAINNLKQIELAAQRAADLAQQMLAYSGKGQFVVEGLDINVLITEMNHILEVSISKKVLIRLNLAKSLPLFVGDATQIRQIIMNLVINASEAVGEEDGLITINTGSMDCDQAYLSNIWQYDKLEEGPYIYFEVADTGCGMDQETLAKIFDPFFTTKFTGRGLGMAAVLGIIRGHLGAITVSSEPGIGTIFKVFLPASHDISGISTQKSASGDHLKGSGTILLVDDEEAILTIGKEMLEVLGYTALTAENGDAALEIYKHHKEEITCIILDLMMPRLDGEQTLSELQRIDPHVKVIMSSGYNELDISHKFIGKGLAGFIQKPYKLSALKEMISKFS